MSQPWGCVQSSSLVCIVRACCRCWPHRAASVRSCGLVAAFMTNTVSIGGRRGRSRGVDDCGVVVVSDTACYCGRGLLTKFCLPRRGGLGAQRCSIGAPHGLIRWPAGRVLTCQSNCTEKRRDVSNPLTSWIDRLLVFCAATLLSHRLALSAGFVAMGHGISGWLIRFLQQRDSRK